MRHSLRVIGLLCLFSSQVLFARVYHERVIWHENPANEAYVSWTTDELGEQSYVVFDVKSGSGKAANYRYKALPIFEGQFQASFLQSGPYFHHVKLSDLKPDTAYYFSVVTDQYVGQEYWFRTAPAGQKEFSLLFGGDSRSGYDDRRHMNQLMRDMLESNPDILALVHGGDFVNDGGKWNDWDRWLHDHALTITSSNRMLPIVPTRGNHEWNPLLFNQIWGWPGQGDSYYTTTIQNFSIVTLNTEISAHGDQKTWLENELNRLSKQSKWIVANYHRPAYPAVKRPSSAKSAWIPLFEEYAIDLAFESDGHTYKQTVPIFRDRHDEEKGVIYVGEGGLGVRQRTPDVDRWYFQNGGVVMSAHHFQLLKIQQDQLVYEGIDENKNVLSSFIREPRPSRIGSKSTY